MSEELIDNYIDRQAITADTDFLKAKLAEAEAAFSKLKEASGQLKSANGLGQVAAATKTVISTNVDFAQSVKAVNSLVEQRAAAEARLVTAQTDMAKETAKLKQQTQEYNRELRNSIKLEEAAEGSIDALTAKVNLLRQQYFALGKADKETAQGMKLKEELAAVTLELNNQKKAVGDFSSNVGNYQGAANTIIQALEKERAKLTELEQARIRVQNAGGTFNPGSAPAAARLTITGFGGQGASTNKALDQIASKAKTTEDAMAALDEEIAKTRVTVEGFARVTEQKQFLNIAGGLGDATKELRFFQKALIDMERNGLGNTQAAKELRQQLAELTDQIGDTRAEIKALSSDTRAFDLFAGGVTFLADTFQTAAGAAALLGASEEDVAEITKNLVAIQSISNGVKGIANELTTKGTLANKLYAFSLAQVKTAMDTTATGTARLKAALISLGIGALIIGVGALVGWLMTLKDGITDTARRQQQLNDVMEGAKSEYAKAVTEVQNLKNAFQQAKEGIITKEQAVKLYNDTIGKTTGQVNSLNEAELALGKNAEAYIRFTLMKAAANIALGKAAEAAFELAEKQRKIIQGPDLIAENEMAIRLYGGGEAGLQAIRNLNAKTLKEFQEDAFKSQVDIIKTQNGYMDIAKDFQKEINAIAKEFKFNPLGYDETKKQKTEDAIAYTSTAFERIKIERQRYIDFLKDKAAQELDISERSNAEQRLYLAEKLQLLKLAMQNEEELSKQETANKIKLAKEAAQREKKGKNEANKATIEANLQQQILLIQAEGQDKQLRSYQAYLTQYSQITQKFEDEQVERQKNKAEELQRALENSLKPRLTPGTDEGFGLFKKLQEDIENAKAKLKELKQGLIGVFTDTANNLIQSYFDRQLQGYDLVIQKNNAAKDAEVARITQLNISDQERADKIEILEAQTLAKNEALERKKAEIEARKAKYEKALAIGKIVLDTIVAVNKIKAEAAVAPLPLKPLVLAQIPFVLLSQGLSLAAVAARPIPKFKHGLFRDYEGPAIVDDGYKKEAIVRADGSVEVADGPLQERMTYLKKGDRVLPDADMLYDAARAAIYRQTVAAAGIDYKQQDDTAMLGKKIDYLNKSVVRAIQNQPRSVTRGTYHGMANLIQWGANQTQYITDKTNWG